MTEHTELLVLILPPQGRLAVAAADTAGLLPGPGLVLALEHKAAAGSQTVAGLLDRERVAQLKDALLGWLRDTADHPPTSTAEAEQVTDTTVARWLASGAEGMDL